MAISLTSTNTSGAVNVNGVDVLTADASGNVSLRTAGAIAALADLRSIGVGQTWQDLTASRASATTYTNSTGRPIQVFISLTLASNGSSTYSINGNAFNLAANAGTGSTITSINFIVPNGNTYVFTGTISKWLELRT